MFINTTLAFCLSYSTLGIYIVFFSFLSLWQARVFGLINVCGYVSQCK